MFRKPSTVARAILARVTRLSAQQTAAFARLDDQAANRLAETATSDPIGAWAALESHYHAFNQQDLTIMRDVWTADPAARLDRPTGKTAYGVDAICADYAEIFARPQRATLRMIDVDAFVGHDLAVFSGTEIIDYSGAGHDRMMRFRATRCFRHERATGRWWQFHFHGSRTES